MTFSLCVRDDACSFSALRRDRHPCYHCSLFCHIAVSGTGLPRASRSSFCSVDGCSAFLWNPQPRLLTLVLFRVGSIAGGLNVFRADEPTVRPCVRCFSRFVACVPPTPPIITQAGGFSWLGWNGMSPNNAHAPHPGRRCCIHHSSPTLVSHAHPPIMPTNFLSLSILPSPWCTFLPTFRDPFQPVLCVFAQSPLNAIVSTHFCCPSPSLAQAPFPRSSGS